RTAGVKHTRLPQRGGGVLVECLRDALGGWGLLWLQRPAAPPPTVNKTSNLRPIWTHRFYISRPQTRR
ncbi:MAG: hypothetical protein KDE51_22465, partial [Anaerolineales bacterium]|nr:hypothetical protein [Anaerolineales bacterium]